MKDFSHQYKNELEVQNQKYWIKFMERALTNVFEKYCKCNELLSNKQI